MGSGKKITVKFNKNIRNIESFLEEGMMGEITSINLCNYGYELLINVSKYEKFNDSLMKSNYYDKSGVACLTAKEAGFYPKDHMVLIIIDFDDKLDCAGYFDIVECSPFFDQWRNEDTKLSYVDWLENELMVQSCKIDEMTKKVDLMIIKLENILTTV